MKEMVERKVFEKSFNLTGFGPLLGQSILYVSCGFVGRCVDVALFVGFELWGELNLAKIADLA